MAIKYKGEVEFQDSEGRTFVLRLGQFQMVSNTKALAVLSGQEHQTHVFLIALHAGAESQKDLTLEDAAEIIDDIGYKKLDTLIKQTKFYRNLQEASEADQSDRDAATARAVALLKPKLEKLRRKATPDVGGVLDELDAFVAAMQPKEGSANPPESTTPSSN